MMHPTVPYFNFATYYLIKDLYLFEIIIIIKVFMVVLLIYRYFDIILVFVLINFLQFLLTNFYQKDKVKVQ